MRSLTASPSSPLLQSSHAYRAIFWAGWVAGTVDITVQSVLFGLRGKTPVYLLQAIAGGWFGESSFQGGVATALLGAFFHFLIAFTAAAVFYLASRRLTLLVRRPIPSGVLYGVVVYGFMTFVVLPLSAYHTKIALPPVAKLVRDAGLHILLIGLPISLMVRKYSDGRLPRASAMKMNS